MSYEQAPSCGPLSPPSKPCPDVYPQVRAHAGQSGACTPAASASGSRAGLGFSGLKLLKSRSEERAKERPGGKNAFHPFMLRKAVKPAGRSALVSSIKTWLPLLTCPAACVHFKDTGHSYQLCLEGKGAAEKVGRSWASQQQVHLFTVAYHKDST